MENEVGMRDLARLVMPDAEIVSASNPEPVLRAINVVAVYESEEESRNGVLALEGIEDDDAAIGLVVLGHKESLAGLQPEDSKIAGETLKRAAKGAAIGAAVAALLIGAAVALFNDNRAAVIGAVCGGALFGAFVGGVWGAFVRFGGSDAYRQSFTATADGVSLVSLHTNDERRAAEAQRLLALNADAGPVVVRRDGGRIWAEE